jgi:hypothetical protein
MLVVWWLLVLAFGNLLYTAALARLEAHSGIENAKVIAALAEYIVPLVAVGALAALAYAAGVSRSHVGSLPRSHVLGRSETGPSSVSTSPLTAEENRVLPPPPSASGYRGEWEFRAEHTRDGGKSDEVVIGTSRRPRAATQKPEGKWVDNRFICDSLKHVFTTVVTAEHNDKLQIFDVPFVPVGAFVDTQVDIDRHDERVKAGVVLPHGPSGLPLEWNSRLTQTSLRLPDDRYLGLRTLAAPEATATTIRVFVKSWTIGPVSP